MGKVSPFALGVLLLLWGCKSAEIKREVRIPRIPEPVHTETREKEVLPDFRLVAEDISPLSTYTLSLNMRAVPLRDVLFVVCRDAGLNLVFEKGVNPDVPVTIVLERVTVGDALRAIFSGLDYYYEIRGNLLVVKATDTEVFRIRTIPIQQDYSVDVGGDILGTVMGDLQAGQVKGAISRSERADRKAYNFWDAVEGALSSMLGGPGESFFVNRMTGTIMVTATKSHMERVRRFIRELNEALSRQVLIEAKVIEVNLHKAFRYGIDWGYFGEWSKASWTWSVEGGTTDFTKVIPPNSPFSELTLHFWKTGRDIQAILQALSEFGDVRTLSNPRVRIANGQTALLTVGRNIGFISKVETTATEEMGVTYTVETSSLLSGIMIGIVPYIGEDGEISLMITPIVSNLVELKEVSLGTQYMVQLPIMDLRELSTTVKVKDGEVLIIGGLMKREEKEQVYGIPLLKDIPLLGEVFKGKSVQESTVELVIILQPKVVS